MTADHQRQAESGRQPSAGRALRPAVTGGSSPGFVAEILDLQRLAGNAATTEFVTQRAPALATAGAELRNVDTERRKAGNLSGKAGEELGAKELAAEHDAEAAAQGALSGRGDASGLEVESVLRRIEGEITRIESARALGYVQAVGDLSAKGMDKEADYTQFGIATAGNLVWALSGLIPEVAVAKIGFTALKEFFALEATTQALWATALGVAGAMAAQFSGGFPSGTSVSSIKVALETSLSSINSAVCNEQRHRAYRLLVGALEAAPPDSGVKTKDYMGQLELMMRSALYGDIFSRGLNSGELVDASKVQQDARDQLLHQYLAGSSAIKDGKLEASAPNESQNMVSEATALLGGADKVHFRPYELVYNQVQTAAADLGCYIDIDEAKVEESFVQQGIIAIPVKWWDSGVVFGRGMPTRWMNPLHTNRIVECDPSIDNEAYMSADNVGRITTIYVNNFDLSTMDDAGKKIHSADIIRFAAEGGKDSKGFISVTNVPKSFLIVYHIKEPRDRFARRN